MFFNSFHEDLSLINLNFMEILLNFVENVGVASVTVGVLGP